ncbi:MAG: sugar transferase [Bacilli bacterium]
MYRYFKRIIDFSVSLIGFIVLLPIITIVALIIKATSKGPILFKQERVGQNDTRFIIYKFRSMQIDTPSEVPSHLLENPDAYITKIGKILRKTSLDELPQLINIIKGDMSIVGPRPSLPNQYDLNRFRIENKAMTLRPGLTGLAQIKGRDELPIPIKAGFDKEYYEKMSFPYDIYIFFATFISVLKSNGVKEGLGDEESSHYR